MFAVIKSGGKQHRVTPGERLKVEKIDAEPGSQIEIDEVLLVGDGERVSLGSPYLPGSKVTATVVRHGRGEKIRVVKFRRRKDSKTTHGHRQWFTELEITAISG